MRTAAYKEELWRPNEEKKPQRQLLDAVFSLQPRIVLRRADVSEYLNPGWQQSVSSHIKEEEEGEEVRYIKEEEEEILHVKEEEQEESIQVPPTGVHLKNKDEGQSEERRWAQPPSRKSSSDGDHCEVSQTNGHHDDDDDYDDDDDDEQSAGDRTCHTANKCCKCCRCRKTFASMRDFKQHVKIHTGEKPFTGSIYGERFSQKGTLKIPTTKQIGSYKEKGPLYGVLEDIPVSTTVPCHLLHKVVDSPCCIPKRIEVLPNRSQFFPLDT
ncbi:zinc finger and SCAN domain-containing protein 20-like isoform X2 [Syngnathoides biaculeatus]|uniref:zinc finger and SCAN domain-containing protein 20-like isoform X2 n=1 Tax=Syngnathoides biaculeatus TaxID=300417 RepID=UPI002ADE5320|nr:zinc finger and SCAN domain-containing protein 20-like isoform X2 [Syngnathoides biaculeatus]